MVGSKVGHFTILARIGSGGMATVWRAPDELLHHDVALKLLSSALSGSATARRRFDLEAKTGANLQHRAIAPVYEWGKADGEMYIAMALIDGETVVELIKNRLLPIDEVLRIATEAAHGLAHAHDRGVIHRDVSSRNVIVARDGSVYLLDFGLALVRGTTRFTSKGTVLGTAAYMAPETFLHHVNDARSDLYSLGVVLYEALTGSLPFGGERDEVVTYDSLNRDVRPPSLLRPEIAPELDAVVLRAMARGPERRYQSMRELIEALQALRRADGPPVPVSPAVDDAVTIAARIGSGQGPIYLAVLPFEARDPEPAWAHQLEDLVTSLKAALAAAGRVHVVLVARERCGEAARDLRAFARSTGSNLGLRARARTAGTAVRITYDLLDPERGEQIAGGNVDGSAVLPFELQDALAASVRAALGIRESMLPEERPARPPDRGADERLTQALSYMQRF